MCGGMLSAVLSTVAAAMPMILTSLLRPPPIIPAKGWGRGVGTGFGAGGAGTMTMCVSVATIWSPCLAAGCPIGQSSVSKLTGSELLQLRLMACPLTFACPVAFKSMFPPASIFALEDDAISISFASSFILPCAAESTTPLSDVMLIVFFDVAILVLV